MPDSNYFFISGEPVEVGDAGEHDYFFHSGTSVRDDGGNAYVFESGTALGGGALEWASDPQGETVIIGSNPRIEIKIDGTGGAAFPVAYRTDTPPSPPWKITFGSAGWTRNSEENNFQFGATTATSSRVFSEFSGRDTLEYGQLDPANPDSPGDFFRIIENGTRVEEALFDPVEFNGISISVEWEPPEARLYIGGDLKAVLSNTFSSSPNFRGGIEVEDDNDTDEPETLRVDGYGERQI